MAFTVKSGGPQVAVDRLVPVESIDPNDADIGAVVVTGIAPSETSPVGQPLESH